MDSLSPNGAADCPSSPSSSSSSSSSTSSSASRSRSPSPIAGSPSGAGSDRVSLGDKLNCETARIAWKELERFFAQGKTVWVAPGEDLVETARLIAEDNAPAVQSRIASGAVGRVSDAQAAAWVESSAEVWAVVVAPWVLVQDVGPNAGVSDAAD